MSYFLMIVILLLPLFLLVASGMFILFVLYMIVLRMKAAESTPQGQLAKAMSSREKEFPAVQQAKQLDEEIRMCPTCSAITDFERTCPKCKAKTILVAESITVDDANEVWGT